jgi:hypothetical protein
MSDERARLIHRTEDLRRLFQGTTASRARAAINAEIAKHEVLIAEIDNKATKELPADQPEEIVAKAPRDIIS